MVVPAVPRVEQTVHASGMLSGKSDEKSPRDGIRDATDQGRDPRYTKQRTTAVHCEDVVRSTGAKGILNLVDETVLNFGQEPSQLGRLLDQRIEKLVLPDPGSEPPGEGDLSPTVPGLEGRMLELRKTACETSLERLVVPDDPHSTRRRDISCPWKPDLPAVCGEDVVKRVQVRAPLDWLP